MQIIVSHDVDHLYPSDHILRDLIFPKLWVRSFIQLCKRQISFSSFWYRLISIFDKRLNRIPEIIAFDKAHGVKSTFFFGMDNILGLSYKKEKTKSWIKYVLDSGFDAGVHGIEIKDIEKMKQEYSDFKDISGLSSFGIRTHYVRYDDNTFNKMEKIGYLFDTSEFNKKAIGLKEPYKVGTMWEFPLHIMDGYIIHNNLEHAKQKTIVALREAEKKQLPYFTFLFHDYMFNGKTYPIDKIFYEWFVKYCTENNYPFISYRDALKVLNHAE
ncbi:conserved hypothetical protein [Treponema phagedenis]|uniref:Polysaccharide deacetylase n=1 Tax=Treponema phagedenis TaxID=162 RepID=A0A0B7GW43_TREPH|nr:hypothetical protein [Treponema phagedenis]QSH95501.1 hypothetical protein C5O78_10850 [Treponema phagedenis]CEM62723.1 conserved hypothetical protein [Treponema phagedenis]